MLAFPNAKINLGLNIVARRPDGYHNIESCFYPIPWHDVLEIIPARAFQFTSSGLPIPGDDASNLCVRAYQLMLEQYSISPVHIHLHKAIPMGAGLGGGSADGAFTVKMLDSLFELSLSKPEMETLAGKLGSDCPFFISNKPTCATGTGTDFHPVEIDLSGRYLALKHPGIHIGTKEAYRLVKPQKPAIAIPDILKQGFPEWKNLLNNDFEQSVFSMYPAIEAIKEELYQKGAVYASMTGSGSAVYGIFDSKPELPGYELFGL